MKRLFILYPALALFLALIVFWPSKSEAANREFNEGECAGLALMASQVALNRLNGYSFDAILVALNKNITNRTANSFIKDEGEAEQVRQLAKLVFDSTATPEQAAEVITRVCGPTKPTGKFWEI